MRASTYKLNDWSIAYSPYVDTLHVYKNILNKKKDKELINKDYGRFIIVLDSNTYQLLLFEMKHASKDFGNIDNMDKRHIIRRVKEMVKNHGNS